MNNSNRFRLSLRWFLLLVCAAGVGVGFLGRWWLAPKPDYNVKGFGVGENHRVNMMVETVANRNKILYAVFVPNIDHGPIGYTHQLGTTGSHPDEMHALCPEGIYFERTRLMSNGSRIWIGRYRGKFSIEPWPEIDEAQVLALLEQALHENHYKVLQVPYVNDKILPVLNRETADFRERSQIEAK